MSCIEILLQLVTQMRKMIWRLWLRMKRNNLHSSSKQLSSSAAMNAASKSILNLLRNSGNWSGQLTSAKTQRNLSRNASRGSSTISQQSPAALFWRSWSTSFRLLISQAKIRLISHLRFSICSRRRTSSITLNSLYFLAYHLLPLPCIVHPQEEGIY